MKSVAKLLTTATSSLAGVSETPRLDAELLMIHALQCSRSDLLAHTERVPTVDQQNAFEAFLTRRQSGEPIAYILGHKEFWGLSLIVDPTVLIPRPDTEVLVEEALSRVKTLTDPISILELGVGSGAISIALASELSKQNRNFHITAVDKCTDALKVAEQNIKKHNLEEQVSLLKSNWFESLKSGETRFDLIVANPPYISDSDPDISDEIKFEPATALFSGEEGLDDFSLIIPELPNFLKPLGYFISEMGWQQSELIMDLVKKRALDFSSFPEYSLTFFKDLAQRDRGFVLKFKV